MPAAPPLTSRALHARWGLARLIVASAAGNVGNACNAGAADGPEATRRAGAAAGSAGATGRAAAWQGAPIRAMGLSFPGPVGLAAGVDRHGVLGGKAERLGFGATETGTLVAGARLASATRLARPHGRPVGALCGVSLGKRAATAWTRAEDDYLQALHAFHARADYVTLNPGRDRPSAARFAALVAEIARCRDRLAAQRGRALPLVVKLPAAWLAQRDRVRVAAAFVAGGADGLLISAEGAPSRTAACAVLREIAQALGRDACVISVGGIDSVPAALARVRAGARLIQIHRAAGAPDAGLVARVNRALAAR